VQRHITLRGQSSDIESTASLMFSQRPVVAGGIIRLAGAAAGVAVMAGAVIFAAVLGVRAIADAVVKGTPEDTAPPATTPAVPSQSPANTGSAPPSPSDTGSPSPSPSPSDTGSPSPSPSDTGPSPPEPIEVNLATPPEGAETRSQRIAPAAYPGLILSAVSDSSRAECANISAVSWVQLRIPSGVAGVVPGGLATDGAGNTTGGVCNDLALRIDLPHAAQQVTLQVIGQTTTNAAARDSLPYIAQAAGAKQPQREKLDIGESGTLTLTDGSGQGLRSVTLSGEPANQGVVVVLTAVTIVSVP
jgi:hypothetical protein